MLTATSEGPSTSDDAPAYAEAIGQLIALRADRDRKLAALRGDLARAEREYNGALALMSDSGTRTPDTRAIIESGGFAPDARVSHKMVRELRQRCTALRRAIEAQQREIQTAHSPLSNEIAAAARPEYEAILARMSDAVAVLSLAAEEEHQFRSRLLEAGVSFASVIPPCALSDVRLTQPGSRASQWAAEVARGYPTIRKPARTENAS